MKKHLIAAAVAAAVAVPAMAQNVTVYGRLDAGYTTTDSATEKTSGIRYNSFTSSRIGFTGTEDLGGGLKASFGLEGGLGNAATLEPSSSGAYNLQSGAPAAYTEGKTGTDTQFNGFGRASWLQLAGSFGAIRAGLHDLATKSLYDSFDVGSSNNLVGSGNNVLGSDLSYLASRGTAIRFTTPATAGFTGNVAVLSQKTNGNKEGSGYELGANYAAGPFKAALAYVDLKIANDLNRESMTVGASYDLGVALLSVIYSDSERETSTTAKTDGKMTTVGVRAPLSGAVTAFASVSDGERATSNADAEGYQLGLQYNLSKRTYGYAAIGQSKVKTGATTEVKTDQTALGIVHMF